MNALMSMDLSLANIINITGLTLLLSAIPVALVAVIARLLLSAFQCPSWRYSAGVSGLCFIAMVPLVIALLLVNFEAHHLLASNAKTHNTNNATVVTTTNATGIQESTIKNDFENTTHATMQPAPIVDKGTSKQSSGSNSNIAPIVETEETSVNYVAPVPTTASSADMALWIQTNLSPWMPSVVTVWVLGLIAFSIRIWIGWRYSNYISQNGLASNELLQSKMQTLCQTARLGRCVKVFVSELIDVPAVVGLFRSIILVPTSAMTNLTTQELESVLRHELAHIRRYDPLVNLLQTLLETTLFFHPAVWWISKQVRIDRELCCDRMAVDNPKQANILARALLRLEESRRSMSPALAATGGNLTARVKRLLEFESSGRAQNSRTGAVTIGLLVLMIFCVFAMAAVVPHEALKQEEKSAVEADDQTEKENEEEHKFDKLKLTIYQDNTEPKHIYIDDKTTIESFLEFFPGATTDRQGMQPAGYIVDYHLEFTGADVRPTKIGLSTSLLLWHAGKGDWEFKSLIEFRKLTNQQVEKADAQAEEKITLLNEKIKGLSKWHVRQQFRSAPYMQVAHLLQQLPGDRRRKLLTSWTKDYQEQLFILCRMLFENEEGFRRPGLGGPIFVDGGKIADWPLEPITLIDNVPFVVVRGYVLGGRPESIKSYLGYCFEKCQWSNRDYSKFDQKVLNAALSKLLIDKKEKLSQNSSEFLAMQVAPQHLDWQLYGKVIDDQGNPLPDVEVRMATGMGTLLGGGRTKTDKDGNYRLYFGEGIWSTEGPNMQVAWLFISKPGYVYKSNSRKIDLSMAMSRKKIGADEMPKSAWPNMNRNDLIVRNQPHNLDLVMSKPAELVINVVDKNGNRINDSNIHVDDANQTSEATSDIFSTNPKPDVDLAIGLATDREWTLSVPIDKRRRQRSAPLKFTQPGRYTVEVELTRAEEAASLQIKSIENNDGENVTNQIVKQNGLADPPLSEPEQIAAASLINDIAEANKLWLKPGGFKLKENEELEFEIERDGKVEKYNSANPRSLLPVWHSGIHVLMDNPDKAVFRSVKMQSLIIEIAFSFKESVRVSYGNGVLGRFNGFVQTNVNEGVISVDQKTKQVLKFKSDKTEIEFSDYSMVNSRGFVPGTITVAKPLKCQWKFDAYSEGLWAISSMQDGKINVKSISKNGMPLNKIDN